MRRRVLSTTKVLAVALAVAPACTKPEARHDTESTAAVSAPAAASVPAARLDDASLAALRTELDGMKREDALTKVAHFRPLCDEAGFPLVGNLARKVAAPSLQPSEVCAEVRLKKGR
jgi:hypothetical protein